MTRKKNKTRHQPCIKENLGGDYKLIGESTDQSLSSFLVLLRITSLSIKKQSYSIDHLCRAYTRCDESNNVQTPVLLPLI